MWSDEMDSKVQRSACVRIFLKTEKKKTDKKQNREFMCFSD